MMDMLIELMNECIEPSPFCCKYCGYYVPLGMSIQEVLRHTNNCKERGQRDD